MYKTGYRSVSKTLWPVQGRAREEAVMLSATSYAVSGKRSEAIKILEDLKKNT